MINLIEAIHSSSMIILAHIFLTIYHINQRSWHIFLVIGTHTTSIYGLEEPVTHGPARLNTGKPILHPLSKAYRPIKSLARAGARAGDSGQHAC